jgi:ankyrin repeat protein
MKIVSIVFVLLMVGCLPDDPAPGGAVAAYTTFPLHEAAMLNDFELARWAINEGFDVNGGQRNSRSQDIHQVTPLHRACKGGHVEMAKFLLDHGADVNATTKTNKGRRNMRGTPLFHALWSSNFNLVVLLVERGADINTPGETPLDMAIRELWARKHWGVQGKQRRTKIVHYLRTRPGASLETTFGFTDLHWAALEGDIETARRLIDEGADVNASDFARGFWGALGMTPLHLAARSGHPALAKLLLDHGAKVNAETKSRSTPLHWAAKEVSLPMVELLVDRGAKLLAKDDDGKIPLDLSRFDWSADIHRYLLARHVP